VHGLPSAVRGPYQQKNEGTMRNEGEMLAVRSPPARICFGLPSPVFGQPPSAVRRPRSLSTEERRHAVPPNRRPFVLLL